VISYYKLVRREEILPQLKSNLLEDRKWRDQLRNKLQLCDYSIMTGYGDDKKAIPFNDMPPLFILKEKSHFANFLNSDAAKIAAAAVAIGGLGLLLAPKIYKSLTSDTSKKVTTTDDEKDKYILICNLDKASPEEKERVLTTLGVLPKLPSQANGASLESLLGTFCTEKDSIITISPEYVARNFPLTYPEEMIYESLFVKHPLVGYEGMLVPLEKYYKFLSEQSFNELLAVLVRLGVKKVELIYSENKLMKNALDAYAGYKNIAGLSATYKENTYTSIHSYWGMEFEGKQISPYEIDDNFLNNYPFHRNNGTLRAMIEGIKSGNRNKVYTVERSFTGSYGLDINSATKALGFEAGFAFNREMYQDEKSTFNVLY
jgi:hypothetical protein